MQIDTLNIHRSFDFFSYLTFVSELVKNNSCSGEISESHIEATKMNVQRINRIEKQIEILPELRQLIESIKENWEWIVLVESWCGDGAQNLPIIAKTAALNDKIKLTIVLRDENDSIMKNHLTNGARAIPILICIKLKNGKELGLWGPRPKAIQEKVKNIKLDHPSITHDELGKNLHLWYAKDKGVSLQAELMDSIKEWKIKSENSNI